MIRLTLSLLIVLLAVSNAFAGERSRALATPTLKGLTVCSLRELPLFRAQQ